jgi:hypothetical protein
MQEHLDFIFKYDSKSKTLTKESITKDERIELIKRVNKLPGTQNLDERIFYAREQAELFELHGMYAQNLVPKTRDWVSFWDTEKAKCYSGLLIDDEFYINGDHYWYLNYIQIPDKVKRKNTFPRIFDTDIWAYQLIELANLTHQFTATVKKRQIGWSLKMVARILKRFWFEEGFVGRIVAYDEKYVKDNWTILELYKDHLNTFTAWKRSLEPDKSLNWMQRTRMADGTYRGNKSILQGITYRTSPAKPVGGKVDEIFAEESGIAPNLDEVLEFANKALRFGDIITGNMHIAGAVGELKDCAPLKNMVLNPDVNNVLSVPNVWSKRPDEKVGIFVPESYSYGSFIDAFGNSLVEEAVKHINAEAEEVKKKSFKSYMLYKSQGPLTLEDAFAMREENEFPVEIIQPHYDYIERTYKPLTVELVKDERGIKHKLGSKYPIVQDFPVGRHTEKHGAVVIHEMPGSNPQLGLYYAGVDTVSPIKGETSNSLQCIYIFKASHEIAGEYNQDLPVAWYTGRCEDPYETYEITKNLIQFYNARAAVENDNRNFLEWMIQKKQQKHLMKKAEIPINKDLDIKSISGNTEYGFRTGSGAGGEVKRHLVSVVAEYVSEVIGTRFNEETGESRDIHGVERIKDKMLLKEMLDYTPKKNVDRICSFALAILAARSNTNRGIKVIDTKSDISEKKDVNYRQALRKGAFSTKIRNPFLR